jgi:hypothetical protein
MLRNTISNSNYKNKEYPSLDTMQSAFELSHSPGVAKATGTVKLNLMKLKLIKLLKQLS